VQSELYHPWKGGFAVSGSLGASRWHGQSATVLLDGTVLVAGGSSDAGTLASAELYAQGLAQKGGAFTATSSMGTSRSGHTATLLLDGSVLITGGVSPSGSTPAVNEPVFTAERYVP
jgi:hypothetical protein